MVPVSFCFSSPDLFCFPLIVVPLFLSHAGGQHFKTDLVSSYAQSQ